ncbi:MULTISPECIES: hypothetical protein [unclassified Mucilaginibacter]|uniref:hypothetical protein n=1 Tax=unclassified Mucilaginibacter TaxID=2617802 RepID=UPI0031F70648
MKTFLYSAFGLFLTASAISCSSGNGTAGKNSDSGVISARPAEQAPVRTATPKADSMKTTDTAGRQ